MIWGLPTNYSGSVRHLTAFTGPSLLIWLYQDKVGDQKK